MNVEYPFRKIVKIVLDDGSEVVPGKIIGTEHGGWGFTVTIILRPSEYKKIIRDDYPALDEYNKL